MDDVTRGSIVFVIDRSTPLVFHLFVSHNRVSVFVERSTVCTRLTIERTGEAVVFDLQNLRRGFRYLDETNVGSQY